MRGNTIQIELPLKRGKVSKTIPLYQYDYGQKLIITGAELPEYYEVHFSNEMHGDAVTSIGDSTGVLIPDALLATGENVYLWLYLHADSDDGETEFQGAIPVIKRAQVTDQTPTPAEQSVITQAIAALTAASAEATEAKEDAEAAQQHIENMGVAATTLPTDSDATVTKTVNASGEVTLTFGLPRGVKGDRGDRGLQGETGNDGEDGEDGFSPVVSLTKSGKVTTFSVTDAEDTYSVEINDGEDGNPGQDATPDLITVDYSDLTFPVAAGTMCYHSGLLYKANQAIATSEEWTAAHWTQTTIEEEHLSLKTEINSKYEKPNTGIPAMDMAQAVQTSLGKADSAYQKPQTGIPASDLESGVIPAVPVQDVQANGVSILNAQGVANVPLAGSSTPGVMKVDDSGTYGVVLDNGELKILPASGSQVKEGTDVRRPLVSANQDKTVFYGFAKAAGDTSQASSANPVGEYTADAIVKIQKMLGIYESPWELIREDTVTNATETDVEITVDGDGNAFELTDVYLQVGTPQQETAASIGDYGAVRCYYDSSNYITSQMNTWSQAANASARYGQVLLENKNGAILNIVTQNATQYSSVGLIGRTKMPNSDALMKIGTFAFNKIVIKKVTGTVTYKLYGKRKWTV